MEEKGSQDGQKPSLDSGLYRVYFKGLIRKETRGLVAGFGVAICGQKDDPVFKMKGSIHDSAITVLEAELMALKLGITEAVRNGYTHISIYCDHYQIFELVMARCAPDETDKIALPMNDVQRIRQQLTSSTPLLVNGDETNKFAYKLALETLVSEICIRMPMKKTLCGICFNNDLVAEHTYVFRCFMRSSILREVPRKTYTTRANGEILYMSSLQLPIETAY